MDTGRRYFNAAEDWQRRLRPVGDGVLAAQPLSDLAVHTVIAPNYF